ncbi:hypothetical protein BKA62DRAFT_1450 [Auriculariales sp. MPI-PUGE-AT-0066]|nr:hypothetical protein BKA62DRAFT_1450 [Auriculariales sp. MPI-PUGE-AT-0066]
MPVPWILSLQLVLSRLLSMEFPFTIATILPVTPISHKLSLSFPYDPSCLVASRSVIAAVSWIPSLTSNHQSCKVCLVDAQPPVGTRYIHPPLLHSSHTPILPAHTGAALARGHFVSCSMVLPRASHAPTLYNRL